MGLAVLVVLYPIVLNLDPDFDSRDLHPPNPKPQALHLSIYNPKPYTV